MYSKYVVELDWGDYTEPVDTLYEPVSADDYIIGCNENMEHPWWDGKECTVEIWGLSEDDDFEFLSACFVSDDRHLTPLIDNFVATIDSWWDRSTRDYCIQKKNKYGEQLGEAIRVGSKEEMKAESKHLREQYGL